MEKVVDLFKNLKGKKILILTHHNADIDAISSAIVLKKYLSKNNVVEIGTSESVAKQCKKILELTGENVLIDPDCKNYDKVIVVDTSSLEQIKTVKNLKIDVLIDHHEEGDIECEYKFVDKNAKSTTYLVYELLKELGYEFDIIDKKLILAGLLSDTSHLKFSNREVFRVFYELMEEIKFSEILDLVAVEEDLSDRVVTIKALKRMNVYKFGEILVAISWVGSHEAIVARNFLKVGIDVAIVSTKKGGELRISSRGKEKILKYGLNLAEMFKEIGKFINGSGGGHDLAGSANGKAVKFDELEKFILKYLVKKLGKYKKVKF